MKEVEMTTRDRLKSILASTGKYEEEVVLDERESVFNLLFEVLAPIGMASTGMKFPDDIFYPGYFDDEDHPAHRYHESVQEYLGALKDKVQENFDTTHAALVADTKKMSLVSGLLHAAMNSKEKNASRIEAAEVAYNAAALQRETSYQTFLQARRAEEYFRMIPTAYKSQSIDDALWGILMCLRTDSWSLLTEGEKFERRERVAKLARF